MNDALTATERLALAEDDGDTLEDLRELVGGSEPADGDQTTLEITAAMSLRERCRPTDAIESDIDRVRKGLEDLDQTFESSESDLDWNQYRQQQRQLTERIQELREERSETKALLTMAEAAEEKEWFRQIDLARQRAKREGIDLNDRSLSEQWDRNVKYLGNQLENANKSARWFLDEGLAMVRARLEDAKAKREGRSNHYRDNHDESYSTGRNPGGDRLSQLKGMALEAALARMTPAEADAWLNS